MWGCGEVAKWWSGEVVKRTMYPMPTYAPMCWKNYVSYAHLCTYVSKTLCILCPPMHLCVEKKHRQHRYNLCFYVNLCAYVLKKLCIYAHLCIYVSKKLCILCPPMHLCGEKTMYTMPTYAPMCRKNYVYYAHLCIYVSKKSIGSIDTPTYVSMPTYASMCRKKLCIYAHLCTYVSKNIP
jgi:hypothetical protein